LDIIEGAHIMTDYHDSCTEPPISGLMKYVVLSSNGNRAIHQVLLR